MRIDVDGYQIDELIKKLSLKVKIFNLTFESNLKAHFEIRERDERKVRRYIANFKHNIEPKRIKKINGFLLTNLGVILGVFVGIVFMIFSSAFTWKIEVFGMKELRRDEIIALLKRNGVRVGKINIIDSEEIESILLNNYDRIAQVSVVKIGTGIIINLSEKLVYGEKEYQPIVAKSAGIVTKINLVTGTSNVKVGDYVNAGDVLVLPFNLNANGEKVKVKPYAEIEGKMFVIEKAEMKKTEKILARTGNKRNIYDYKYKNKVIFSYKNKNPFAFFECVVYNESVSRLVPFSRDVIVCFELTEKEITHDFATEKTAFLDGIKKLAYDKLSGDYVILDEEERVDIKENKMVGSVLLTTHGMLHD